MNRIRARPSKPYIIFDLHLNIEYTERTEHQPYFNVDSQFIFFKSWWREHFLVALTSKTIRLDPDFPKVRVEDNQNRKKIVVPNFVFWNSWGQPKIMWLSRPQLYLFWLGTTSIQEVKLPSIKALLFLSKWFTKRNKGIKKERSRFGLVGDNVYLEICVITNVTGSP